MSTIKVDDVEALSTNGNLQIAPNGTGVVEVKSENSDATLQLNDSQQLNNVKIKSPNDTAAQNYTLILPNNNIAADKFLTVNTITGSGSTATGQLEFATIAEPDITQLNASEFTTGTIPGDRISMTGANGGGLQLVSKSTITTFNTIEYVDFTLQANTAYKLIGNIYSDPWGYVVYHKMLWQDQSNNNQNVTITRYDGTGDSQSNHTVSTIDLFEPQYYGWFEADIINGEDYDSVGNPLLPATPNANHWKRTWMLLWGGHADGYTKTEIRASMPHGQNRQIRNLRLVATQYYGNTNYFQPHTEFVLYKYNES